MNVLHISAECYPAAKAGGLGDVVGALPKYSEAQKVSVGVVIPKYQTEWLVNHKFTPIYRGTFRIHKSYHSFTIEREKDNTLGFPLFVVNLPQMFDRTGIYNDVSGQGYPDNMERFLAFDLAVLQWLANSPSQPDLLHCHDHPTGFIPFLVKHAPGYRNLEHIPTLFTIHNAAYHGDFGWEEFYKLPWFDEDARGILDWEDRINPMAIGIKSAWRISTVSETYLEEMKHHSANGLEWLIHHEQHKAVGILNGIDAKVWDPKTDEFIEYHLEGTDIDTFKENNKAVIREKFGFDNDFPIVIFIGSLIPEKGADLLPDLIKKVIASGMKINMVVLGKGDRELMVNLCHLQQRFSGQIGVKLTYDEELAHQLYAGSDFLFMPSRVEPCGMNQMFAMRYGTIPIVRSVGGLKDSVPDIDQDKEEGRGVRFDGFSVEAGYAAIYRALNAYFFQPEKFEALRKKVMAADFSWNNSAKQYTQLYKELIEAARNI